MAFVEDRDPGLKHMFESFNKHGGGLVVQLQNQQDRFETGFEEGEIKTKI